MFFFRPHLVCLDLGDCEFQDQRALLDALSTLPRLTTLVLEGNPFTQASLWTSSRSSFIWTPRGSSILQ